MGMLDDLANDWDEIKNPFYPVDPNNLFQAAVAAGAELGWTIQQVDGTSRTITFVAEKDHVLFEDGLKTQGYFSVFILPETRNGAPGSRLRTAGKANHVNAVGGGVFFDFSAAVHGALIDMGLLKDGEFVDSNARPPRKAPAPTSGTNPFVDEPQGEPVSTPHNTESGISSELKELAALHQSGALTDEEFSAAKSRILGA